MNSKTVYVCKNCDEDSGYLWDYVGACPVCAKGKEIQHKYDKDELEAKEKRCRFLRKKIKSYEVGMKFEVFDNLLDTLTKDVGIHWLCLTFVMSKKMHKQIVSLDIGKAFYRNSKLKITRIS